MPRRPPPTSLRLVQGPLPPRGIARHTLPSVPRPALAPLNVSRETVLSTDSTSHAHANYTAQPRRRSVERGLGTSGLGPGVSVGVSVGYAPGAGYSSPSSASTPSPSPQAISSPPLMRGPWDYSRAVSLTIDVGSVLALPKPAAISP
ncbi:hypothetical protein M0805_003890 [Coniferiporia weirii]|nr:hypothetical protein M0805_003890 [Coniferiporia weirii]